MAQTATIYNLTIDLSDIDRGVYETLELRVAQQPSETLAGRRLRQLAARHAAMNRQIASRSSRA